MGNKLEDYSAVPMPPGTISCRDVDRYRAALAAPVPGFGRATEWDLWRLPEEPTWAEMVKWDHALRRR